LKIENSQAMLGWWCTVLSLFTASLSNLSMDRRDKVQFGNAVKISNCAATVIS